MRNTATSTIWNERYRPGRLDQLLGNEHLLIKLAEYAETAEIPHLMFIGPAGVGKSSAAKILAHLVTSDVMYLNASSEGGIDVIRTKVERFCTTMSFSPFKVIILDEFDFVTLNAQACLRNIMEAYHENSRFILTANYAQRIIDPIRSRCQVYEFTGAGKKEVAVRLAGILKNEGVAFTKAQVVDIVKSYHPDIRKMINTAQQLTVDGTLQDVRVLETEMGDFAALIKSGDIDKIRDELGRKNYVLQQLYEYLFWHVQDIVGDTFRAEGMLTVADALRTDALVIDKVINFVACCISLASFNEED